jgi:hypothetical protein
MVPTALMDTTVTAPPIMTTAQCITADRMRTTAGRAITGIIIAIIGAGEESHPYAGLARRGNPFGRMLSLLSENTHIGQRDLYGHNIIRQAVVPLSDMRHIDKDVLLASLQAIADA